MLSTFLINSLENVCKLKYNLCNVHSIWNLNIFCQTQNSKNLFPIIYIGKSKLSKWDEVAYNYVTAGIPRFYF